jgi:hypothetical protein
MAAALGQQRLDVGPLFIGQHLLSHPQLFPYRFGKSAKKIIGFRGDL